MGHLVLPLVKERKGRGRQSASRGDDKGEEGRGSLAVVLGALGVFSHMEGVKKSGRGGSGK